MTKELEALESIAKNVEGNDEYLYLHYANDYTTLKYAIERKEKLEMAIKDLFANHIEFVAEKDKCYFKIKNSKGKEISFTSKTFEEFWKEVIANGN